MAIRRHRRKQKRSEAEKKRLRRKAVLLPVGILIVCLLSAGMYLAVDKRDMFSIDEFLDFDRYNTVEINGVRCRRKTRIKSYLFMGVDSKGKVGEYLEEEVGTGQCDVLQLVVIDQNENTYTIFPINRDTFTEVATLREDGSLIASRDIQIAFAHSSGDGREISCENTVDAVSHLLLDQPVDGYLALNMDSIGVINHELGGVTVTIEDDFSENNESLKIGDTVKLTDEQAVSYVRGRMDVGDGSNQGRMRRQDQYLENAAPILREKMEADERFINQLYNALGDYMVTSLSGKDVSKLAKAIMSNEELAPPEIKGETFIDEYEFMRFVPDEDSVADAVLELFYERV